MVETGFKHPCITSILCLLTLVNSFYDAVLLFKTCDFLFICCHLFTKKC